MGNIPSFLEVAASVLLLCVVAFVVAGAVVVLFVKGLQWIYTRLRNDI